MSELVENEVNLATKNIEDFTVLANGSTLTSQRKIAEFCGVSQSAISQICLSRNLDVKQGVTEEIAVLLIMHYALYSKKTTIEAKKLMEAIGKAGYRAYVYHQSEAIVEHFKLIRRVGG
jgi:transcriptional regulator with XRE-family HTH domain